jgi:small subunit ribosomal protein S12e
MSDAGDNVEVEATEVEVAEAEVSEAPKGKLSVEEALEVNSTVLHPMLAFEISGDD